MATYISNAAQASIVSTLSIVTIGGTKLEMLNHYNYFSWRPRALTILKKQKI